MRATQTVEAKPRVESSPRVASAARVLHRKCARGGTPGPSGGCDNCRKKRLARGGLSDPAPATLPPIVHEVLRSPGQPLDAPTEGLMGSRFGHNFVHIRVHADGRAAESARAVNALAYTVGRDVVFGAGHFQPATEPGRRLIAHELAHTIQQSGASSSEPEAIVAPNDQSEYQADRAADAVMAGKTFSPNEQGGASIARQAAPAASQKQSPPAEEAKPPSTRVMPLERHGFGRFDATLEPEGKPLPAGEGKYGCKLNIETTVKFNQVDTPDPWPKGRFATWKQEFMEKVQRHWSTRYLLVPAAACPAEPCASAVVYVKFTEVSSSAHHEVNVSYSKPFGARSEAWVAEARPGQFYSPDTERAGFPLRQTTAFHESGHWFGLEHIHCPENGIFCYGVTAGESDDMMGRGDFVSESRLRAVRRSGQQTHGAVPVEDGRRAREIERNLARSSTRDPRGIAWRSGRHSPGQRRGGHRLGIGRRSARWRARVCFRSFMNRSSFFIFFRSNPKPSRREK